ncbi:unnamed protein product [Soboliphyme baturini]|uniref:Ig-like domain-containing protein n=1 Tax=Soboliphyme baturini TaxID=241478 RepID=A0A183IK73_9BILA|nr:unnamed protein product [Soboliphyme baturini]
MNAKVRRYKNGQELVPSDRILTWTDSWGFQRLAILNADLEDEGQYKCTAVNSEGSAYSEAQLSVLQIETGTGPEVEITGAEKPQTFLGEYVSNLAFLRHLRNGYVFSGFPIIFDCVVCGQVSEFLW